jgi:glyoxylase-like metal-dependent hydrolase (beta-lactamase superfamily II)/ferredoxin
MARPDRRRPENVPGDFYVDSTCIDCAACRELAPSVFEARGGQSAVTVQPGAPEIERQALLALTACPTASIGTLRPHPDLAAVRASFPLPVDAGGDVLYCGYHSEKSFGAASYFLPRVEGNLLIDSPREAAPLFASLEKRGGVSAMLLTHGDDVADHAAFHRRFGLARSIHAGDGRAVPEAEELFQGTDPITWSPDLTVIPVPGHTRGSCCFLYKERYLFTGDHLAWSARRGHLYAFRDACWYSWKTQIASMERLLDYSFEWVLPGHGSRVHMPAAEMRKSLETCVAWMKARG